MGVRLTVGFALCVAAQLGILGCFSSEASPVDGTWKIRDLVLEIFDCQQTVCGRIVWLKDPQRRPKECGQIIVWGLSPNGTNSWSNGSIYDPTNGKTYRLAATLEPGGTLNARIYKGIPAFGETKILMKVAPRSLDGWCV
jgi:uncharacterized protein (DUF2147 family)